MDRTTSGEGVEQFNYRSVAEAIKRREAELLRRLRSTLQSRLEAMEPARALTLLLFDGDRHVRTLAPSASREYAGALISFCRNKPYNGLAVDTVVTGDVLEVIQEELLSFYASEQVCGEIATVVMAELESSVVVTQAIRGEISDVRAWLMKELATIKDFDHASSIATQMIDVTADQLHAFFESAAGKQIVVVLSKLLATASGKMLVLKLVKAAIAKVLASAALKSTLLAILKKIGIGLLLKTAVGKAIVAILAFFGIAHVPVMWVLLPILAAFLVYEYRTFPEKLAKRVPDEVCQIIKSKFSEINESIVKNLVFGMFREIIERFTALDERVVADGQ